MKLDPSDFAYKRVCAMWRKLGKMCADKAAESNVPENVEKWGLLADGCYWRSTGDMDTYDIVRKP